MQYHNYQGDIPEKEITTKILEVSKHIASIYQLLQQLSIDKLTKIFQYFTSQSAEKVAFPQALLEVCKDEKYNEKCIAFHTSLTAFFEKTDFDKDDRIAAPLINENQRNDLIKEISLIKGFLSERIIEVGSKSFLIQVINASIPFELQGINSLEFYTQQLNLMENIETMLIEPIYLNLVNMIEHPKYYLKQDYQN